MSACLASVIAIAPAGSFYFPLQERYSSMGLFQILNAIGQFKPSGRPGRIQRVRKHSRHSSKGTPVKVRRYPHRRSDQAS
jgi:hypothetical protein